MPTGTYVQTRLWLYNDKNVMEVEIFPSRADIGKSDGLCSRLGSGTLLKRDGTAVAHSKHPDDFSLSWRYHSLCLSVTVYYFIYFTFFWKSKEQKILNL